ncbi:39 kDa FK506-binding nuclear protein-like [Linepithema humile]|uniref:39 kDa FK506-binding nuclear protein-like n=1 Tax=Linepithema humile TaxID=83485 RepID=UPI0006236394|nr:PREDICTED: major centromere autoantigen B-like [Linepithema humile]
MFMFTLLSSFLILSHICTVGDGDWDSLKLPVTIITAKNVHGHVLHNIEFFYEDCAQPRRRLLEHSHWIKQAYRSNDYNDVVPRRYRSQNKLDDNRSYHSSIRNEEDENEDEEEEEEEDEGDEENKINDETVDDETDEQEENEEETVAAPARSGSRNRELRSGYVLRGSKVSECDRQKVVRIRSATEECEDESTEPSQYYEYETEVKNIASQDGNKCRVAFFAKIFGVSFLILFL